MYMLYGKKSAHTGNMNGITSERLKLWKNQHTGKPPSEITLLMQYLLSTNSTQMSAIYFSHTEMKRRASHSALGNQQAAESPSPPYLNNSVRTEHRQAEREGERLKSTHSQLLYKHFPRTSPKL